MENQKKNMENDTETLGPFTGARLTSIMGNQMVQTMEHEMESGLNVVAYRD